MFVEATLTLHPKLQMIPHGTKMSGSQSLSKLSGPLWPNVTSEALEFFLLVLSRE